MKSQPRLGPRFQTEWEEPSNPAFYPTFQENSTVQYISFYVQNQKGIITRAKIRLNFNPSFSDASQTVPISKRIGIIIS
jgi:hypothetical protein